MRIILFPEKQDGGVGKLNGHDTNVAMLTVAPLEEYGELLAALDICSKNVYHQTRYIHKIIEYSGILHSDTDEGNDRPVIYLLYINKDSLLRLAQADGVDVDKDLISDIEEMRKVRRELISVLGITDVEYDYRAPERRLDYMDILPACFKAILNNNIPQRRLYHVIHAGSSDAETVAIVNKAIGILRTSQDGDEEDKHQMEQRVLRSGDSD